MVNRRVDMRNIRDVLICLFERRFSQRKTAELIGLNRTTIKKYHTRFIASGLPWPLPPDIDDLALEKKLFPISYERDVFSTPPPIDFALVHAELKKDGATLITLHLEWMESTPEEFHVSYSQFCRLYRTYTKSLKISMRRTEIYGETAYVDYSGATISIVNAGSGEIKEAQIFVGVLGGSNYTFCEATWTQRSADWIGSHVRMFEYFGGTPRSVVPDNLKAAVTTA